MSCPFGYGNSSPHFQQLASKGRSNGTLLTRGEKSEEDIENTTLLSPDNVNGMESSEAPASNSSSSGEEVAHRSLEGSTNASPEDKRSMKMTPKHQMLRAMNDAKNTTDHPYYRDYIGLKTILHSQHPLSAKVGEPAHDEMLFIITHQTYELWFKQILHELRRIYSLMLPENVSSLHSIQTASTLLLRIHMIQANLIKQMDILDTMTPMSFLEFRDYLVPASGFQSVQFRMIEILMGLPIEKRRCTTEKFLMGVFDEEERQLLLDMREEPSLKDLVEQWLERIPFYGGDDSEVSWPQQFKEATESMLDKDEVLIRELFEDDEVRLEAELKSHNMTRKLFDSLFNIQAHEEMVARGARSMSQKSILAGVFACLYREEPMLAGPYKLIEGLIELDEGFYNWRWRHVSTAHRQLGVKMGTGGSSGADYLAKAASENKAFKDLSNLVSFLIPQSAIPPIGSEFRQRLGLMDTPKGTPWLESR